MFKKIILDGTPSFKTSIFWWIYICCAWLSYHLFISSWNFFKIINITSISITYKYIVLNKNILYINNKLNFIFNLENEYSVHTFMISINTRGGDIEKARGVTNFLRERRVGPTWRLTSLFSSIFHSLGSYNHHGHMYPKYWYTLLHFVSFITERLDILTPGSGVSRF